VELKKMLLRMLKSKIHRATVTAADLNYVGSITIDEDLLDSANMIPGEQVQVLNVENGARFITYIILGERGSGTIMLNGPAARLAQLGDRVIVLTYADMTEEEAREYKPIVVHVDEKNRAID